jgi:predicted NBD/HSP70 family sugar kinase
MRMDRYRSGTRSGQDVSTINSSPRCSAALGAIDKAILGELMSFRCPDLPPGPIADLFERLHDLHLRAGEPSARSIASDLGISPNTVHLAFSRPQVPKWRSLELIVVKLCDITSDDPGVYRRLWHLARKVEMAGLDEDTSSNHDVKTQEPPLSHERVEARRESATESPAIAQQRAIGIEISYDSVNNCNQLTGVVTDIFGRTTEGPVEVALPNADDEPVLQEICGLVETLRSKMDATQLVGVGLGAEGQVSQGKVLYSPNARWDHYPLVSRLASKLKVPVVLENYANALAVYENRFTQITGEYPVVIVLTRDAVGCGLAVGGRILRGATGMAGEIGHMIVDYDADNPPRCRCMNRGCLEGLATPRAIGQMMQESGSADVSYSMAIDLVNGTYGNGDPRKAIEALSTAGSALGRGIAALSNLINPENVLIFGPTELIGKPGLIDGEPTRAGSRASQIYRVAMLEALNASSFSTSSDDSRLIARIDTPELHARSAAACLISSRLWPADSSKPG